jgi:hypothetical protein
MRIPTSHHYTSKLSNSSPSLEPRDQSKTIYIQEIDEDCRPIKNSFTRVLIESNDDLKQTFGGKGEALYKLSKPMDRITKMKQLEEGEKYNVFSRYERSFAEEVCDI